MNLLPKDEKFFELFRQHARILCQASRLLTSSLQAGYRAMCDASKEIEALERGGDEVIHEIFRRLQSTFLTPFDPEDIQALATALDDVLDAIEDTTFRIVAYRLDLIPEACVRLCQLVHDSCRSISSAIESLHDRSL